MLAKHEEIMKVVQDYDLKIPTAKDVYECAEKSFSKYFKSKKTENEIKLQKTQAKIEESRKKLKIKKKENKK